MGIEENIERIASALERIASAQEENTKINAWYKGYLAGKTPVIPASEVKEVPRVAEPQTEENPELESILMEASTPSPAPVQEPVAPAEAPRYANCRATDLSFDELKEELARRGYTYKKGTKSTTLQREWELHKHEPYRSTPVDVNPAGYAPSLTEAPAPAPAPVTPAPAPAPAPAVPNPFAPSVAPASTPAPMTKDEAYKRISQSYNPNDPKDVDAVVAALRKVGAQTFPEVQEGQFEVVVAEYERLKGITNA